MMDKEALIKKLGWSQWYHPDYWVNPKASPQGSDHTYYGMGLEEAYKFETDPEFAQKQIDAMCLHKSALSWLSNPAPKEIGQ